MEFANANKVYREVRGKPLSIAFPEPVYAVSR
jgi:hypothetical protein